MLLLFIAGALAARITFWAFTNRQFEDGLTTVTHARNAALGLGLTHHPGEGPVHGFTSAISVLIPLVGELIHHGAGIDSVRISSLVFVCVALVYARLICRDLKVGAFPTAFVLAYLSFDQNMIFYGMSGMETQVAVAILLAGFYHVRRQDLVASGIWLGLAPLVRPDFVLWVAPAIAYLAIANRRRAAAVAGIGLGVVAPWVIFTTAYYGSPIPNTIVAKSTQSPTPAILSSGWVDWLVNQVYGHVALLIRYLEPLRGVWSASATPVPRAALTLIALTVLFFVGVGLIEARHRRDMWPLVAFLGLFFAYRVYFLPTIAYYDWYMPPFLGALMIVAAVGMQRFAAEVRTLREGAVPLIPNSALPLIPKAAAVVLAVAFAMHMPFSFPVERNVQIVENEVRMNVGLYLRANMQPGQSVTAEPAGYIGYYSGAKLYDYPGLTSKTSLRAMKSLPTDRRTLADLISVLQPDWLVLRPWELAALQQKYPAVASEYEVQKVFEVPGVPDSKLDQLNANSVSFAGYSETDIDMKFIVLRRTSPTS